MTSVAYSNTLSKGNRKQASNRKGSRVKILTVGNFKGGVGKTAISKFLAEAAAIEFDLRTLAIDLDPQCNLSRRFVEMFVQDHEGQKDYAPGPRPDWDPSEESPEDQYSSSADIWRYGDAATYPTRYQRLEVLPAHGAHLGHIEEVERADIYDAVVRHLKQYLEIPEIKADYDLVILDTRPSKGPLVQAALNSATHVLIPTQLEDPSIEGLHGMLSLCTISNEQRSTTDPLRIVGIAPNMVQSNLALHDTYRDQLRDDPLTGPYLLGTELRNWTVYKENMLVGEPSLFERKSRSRDHERARDQLRGLAGTVFERMGVSDHG